MERDSAGSARLFTALNTGRYQQQVTEHAHSPTAKALILIGLLTLILTTSTELNDATSQERHCIWCEGFDLEVKKQKNHPDESAVVLLLLSDVSLAMDTVFHYAAVQISTYCGLTCYRFRLAPIWRFHKAPRLKELIRLVCSHRLHSLV